MMVVVVLVEGGGRGLGVAGLGERVGLGARQPRQTTRGGLLLMIAGHIRPMLVVGGRPVLLPPPPPPAPSACPVAAAGQHLDALPLVLPPQQQQAGTRKGVDATRIATTTMMPPPRLTD